MVKYIIYPDIQSAVDLINQINTCMGWPSADTDYWMSEPDWMCDFDLQTGDKTSIGYGVKIKDSIYDCLTPEQKSEVFEIPTNINTCVWVSLSGTTEYVGS